jgi:hypothetical protein
MNITLIILYLWFLIQTRSLPWALIRVRASEMGGRAHAGRAKLTSKH